MKNYQLAAAPTPIAPFGWSRSRRPRWFSFLLALAAITLNLPGCVNFQNVGVKPSPSVGEASAHEVSFDFEELNYSTVDVSPDGRTILFDSLGELYLVPIEGGKAQLLRGEPSWDMMARFSPDGKKVVFSSDAGMETFDLWIMPATGGEAKLLVAEPVDLLGPEWGPEGNRIIAWRKRASFGGEPATRKQSYGLAEFAVPSITKSSPTHKKIIEDGFLGIYPSFEKSGHHLYYGAKAETAETPGDDSRATEKPSTNHFLGDLWRLNLATGEREPLRVPTERPHSPFAPRVSPNGKLIAFHVRNGEKINLHLLDIETRNVREIATFSRPVMPGVAVAFRPSLPSYDFTPDSQEIVMAADGKLRRIELASGKVSTIPFSATFEQNLPRAPRTTLPLPDKQIAVKQMRWPSYSHDRKTIVFSALGKVRIYHTQSGQTRRVTVGDDREYGPALSPDGREVAYVRWADDGTGQIMRVGLERGDMPRAVTADGGYYMNPTWSPDGSRIAFLQAERKDIDNTQSDQLKLNIVEISSNNITTVTTDAADIGGWKTRVYTPITFSENGEQLHYMSVTPRPNGIPFIGINSVAANGGSSKEYFKFSSGDLSLEHAVVSPDGRRVALIYGGQLWVANKEQLANAAGDDALDLETLTAVAGEPVSRHHPSYISWVGSRTLRWGVANRFYETDLAQSKTELFATVDLKVPRAVPSGTVAYINAQAVTMSPSGVIDQATVVVKNDRIAAIGPTASTPVPDGALVVDLSGKTIIPGLIDTHAHPHGGEGEYLPIQPRTYTSSLAYGLTTLFDPAGDVTGHLTQAAMVETGDMVGPRILTVGRVVIGERSNAVQTPEDANRLVHDLRDHGAWGIKSYLMPRRDQRQWLIEAARKEGLGVVTHFEWNPWVPMVSAAEGHIAVEHMMPVPPIYEDWVKFLFATGTHQTPTLYVQSGNAGPAAFLADGQYDEDEKIRRFVKQSSYDAQVRAGEKAQPFFALAKTPPFQSKIDGMANVLRAGGRVSMGAHGELNGLSSHMEMWLLVKHGFSPLEALSTYTTMGAHKLGIDDETGSLQAGYLADFLVLNSNPLDDIRNTDDIEYVVKSGFLYDAESMTQLYPEYRPLSKPFWHSEEDWEKYKAPLPAPLPGTISSPTVQ